ncbi:hypothetical protein [Zobellella iuensis]|uniref:Uncharacterized protein n=1 Tax=Zobellella iuensis TaxID=2803811 RepID=A0ABS1QX89_9GAMM|nr:hypothetical protein [Zobellella iuensis]MBL1379498.1 hypothetical protein [Zobellella iuensis]
MSAHEQKQLIASFWDLPIEAQQATARFLVGAKLGEIVEAHAHGVVEVEVEYFRHGKCHKLVWDASHGKLLGGTEQIVIDEVLTHLPASGRAAALAGGQRIRHIKVKHAKPDDREYLHVHYLSEQGAISNQKLELDGSPFCN